jgi:hypothetical protein
VTSILPNLLKAGSGTSVTVTGTGFAPGATLSFANGPGPAPTASNVTFVSPTTLTAWVKVGKKGAKGSRVWDVVVTNPGGQAGVLPGGFTVIK